MFLKGLPIGSSISIVNGVVTGTNGSVLFFGGGGGTITQDNANFFWDDSANKLGIGTNAPVAKVSINGASGTLLGVNFSGSGRPVELRGDNAGGSVVGIRNTNAAGPGSLAIEDETGTTQLMLGYNNSSNLAFLGVTQSTLFRFNIIPAVGNHRGAGAIITTDPIWDGSAEGRAAFCWGNSGAHNADKLFDIVPVAIATPANANLTIFRVQGAAHTAVPTPTDFKVIDFDFGQTVQFATGDFSDACRGLKITAPTLAAVGATTITRAATVWISAAPSAGANVTLSDPMALWVDAGKVRFDGDFSQGANGGSSIGFFGTAPTTKQTVTGAKGGNAALGSLMTALVAYGLVTDSTTA